MVASNISIFVLIFILNTFSVIISGQHEALVNAITTAASNSDPVSSNLIKGYLPAVKYYFYNATFTGLKICTVKNLQINPKKQVILFNLESPQIEMVALYKLRGKLGRFSVYGEGPVHVLIDDYFITFECDYENNNNRIRIANYFIEAIPRNEPLIDFKNLSAGDEEKTGEFKKFFNENLMTLEMELRAPALNTFMDVLIENINKNLESIPAEEIIT